MNNSKLTTTFKEEIPVVHYQIDFGNFKMENELRKIKGKTLSDKRKEVLTKMK